MLFYTVLQVLFSYVYGFGPKKYLSTPDLRKWHNNPYIFAITKYGNFLQHGLRSGIHLVCVYNLFNAIWCNIKWKQGVRRLFAIASTLVCRLVVLLWSGLVQFTPKISKPWTGPLIHIQQGSVQVQSHLNREPNLKSKKIDIEHIWHIRHILTLLRGYDHGLPPL